MRDTAEIEARTERCKLVSPEAVADGPVIVNGNGSIRCNSSAVSA